MKKRQVAAVGFSIITLLFVQVFFWTENKQADRDAQGYIELEGMKTNSVTNQQRETHVLNFIEDDGQNPWTRRIYKPKTENKQNPVLIAYEIEHELSPETPEGKLRRQYAQRHGARGKVTLHVVDSIGNPVSDAQVIAWFWTGDEKNRKVDALTDKNGFVELEENNMSYMGFTINKPSFYDTVWDYWFYVRGYDCVEDGRWIPWNPVLEVVLKEKRRPVSMLEHVVRIDFPIRESVGFDFIAGDVVSPFGKGVTADLIFRFDHSVQKSPYCYSNAMVICANDGGGILYMQKDSFSTMPFVFEAPSEGYVPSIVLGYMRTDDKVLLDKKLESEQYWIVKSKSHANSERFSVVKSFRFGGSDKGPHFGWLEIIYCSNPTLDDRNLEAQPKAQN